LRKALAALLRMSMRVDAFGSALRARGRRRVRRGAFGVDSVVGTP
jgi:hypothetical protein